MIPLEPFRSRRDVGRFEKSRHAAGLTVRGPNMAGGSVFDDFTGDGLPDILTSSFDVDLGGSLFVNRGDGTFEDRSVSSGLASQPLAVNTSQADFDNDGRLDVLLLRGGWETPYPLSLLRNKGEGVFEDVTKAAGLAEPIASHSGAWGDFDNDGNVDLYVCGEFGKIEGGSLFPGGGNLAPSDPRNRCRLYRNRGDGTFKNVAETASSAMTALPKVPPGETTTAMARSTCSSPISPGATASTTIAATERLKTSPRNSASPSRITASRAGSGTSTTTGDSTFSSTITRATSTTPWPAP